MFIRGAFRRDGSFVPLPPPEPAVLEEAWRRAVLAEFVRRDWLEEDAAASMLARGHGRSAVVIASPLANSPRFTSATAWIESR